MAALDEFAAVPFLDHELFMLVRAIEKERLGEDEGAGIQEEPASGGGGSSSSAAPAADDDGETRLCERPAACLEYLLTSQAVRVRADESMERGLEKKAAASLEEANGLMEAFLQERHRLPRPSRYEWAASMARGTDIVGVFFWEDRAGDIHSIV